MAFPDCNFEIVFNIAAAKLFRIYSRSRNFHINEIVVEI